VPLAISLISLTPLAFFLAFLSHLHVLCCRQVETAWWFYEDNYREKDQSLEAFKLCK
jgi:hypothetical protein